MSIMLTSQQIAKRLGSDVVECIEKSVERGFVAAWSRDVNYGNEALEVLLVRMLASVVGTHDRGQDAQERARECAEMLIRIVDNLPTRKAA